MAIAFTICAIVFASATVALAVVRLISHKRLEDSFTDFEASQNNLTDAIKTLSEETDAASTETTALLSQPAALAALADTRRKHPSIPLAASRSHHR